MKKIQMKLLIICVIFSITLSCNTTNIKKLPVIPEKPILSDDSQVNEGLLIVHHYRWLLWSYSVKYAVGEISEKQYRDNTAKIQDIVDSLTE